MITELLSLLGNEFRNNTHLKVLIRVKRLLWPVNENVFLSRVTMHVYER